MPAFTLVSFKPFMDGQCIHRQAYMSQVCRFMYFQHVIKSCSHAVCLEDRVLLMPQSPRASSQLFLRLLNSKQVILSSEKEATEWVLSSISLCHILLVMKSPCSYGSVVSINH